MPVLYNLRTTSKSLLSIGMLSNRSFSLFIKSAIPMEANEKRDKGNENCFIEKYHTKLILIQADLIFY